MMHAFRGSHRALEEFDEAIGLAREADEPARIIAGLLGKSS